MVHFGRVGVCCSGSGKEFTRNITIHDHPGEWRRGTLLLNTPYVKVKLDEYTYSSWTPWGDPHEIRFNLSVTEKSGSKQHEPVERRCQSSSNNNYEGVLRLSGGTVLVWQMDFYPIYVSASSQRDIGKLMVCVEAEAEADRLYRALTSLKGKGIPEGDLEGDLMMKAVKKAMIDYVKFFCIDPWKAGTNLDFNELIKNIPNDMSDEAYIQNLGRLVDKIDNIELLKTIAPVGITFVFHLGVELAFKNNTWNRKVENVLVPTGGAGGAVAVAKGTEAALGTGVASAFGAAALCSVLIIWETTQVSRGIITEVEFRRNSARTLGGAAAGTAAACGVVAAVTTPAGWLALAGYSALVLGAGVGGGVVGSVAASKLDAALWDAEEDQAMHAYQFFGFKYQRMGKREDHGREKLMRAFKLRLYEQPHQGKAWVDKVTQNWVMLLRAMNPKWFDMYREVAEEVAEVIRSNRSEAA